MADKSVAVVKANNIRSLLAASKRQMEMALPKHLTADRLIRVAMTSIQKTPKLLDCTQQSLLACIMTCASLGLEPDQFLGQAYLVPYGNECTLIPGYRGYIALARRSGDLQSLSAQAVYSRDSFHLQFGIKEKLEHLPYEPTDEDMKTDHPRGTFRGAYCVFKYKDGSYSFDYMNKAEIDAIRKRSKASGSGPWVTDYAEMAKKTVIKRHVKLAPLSVEFQRAVALEDRAVAGESQKDLLGLDTETDTIDIQEENPMTKDDLLAAFEKTIPEGTDPEKLKGFIAGAAQQFKTTEENVKIEAGKTPGKFWQTYAAFVKKHVKKDEGPARHECPSGGFVTAEICATCGEKTKECPNPQGG